jgi:hypothetical protein
MSTHGIQRDPCCVFPADGKTVTKDLFELKAVADGVYAAIAGSRTCALRIISRAPSRASGWGSIRWAFARETRLQSLMPARWSVSEPTSAAAFHDRPACRFLNRLRLGPRRHPQHQHFFPAPHGSCIDMLRIIPVARKPGKMALFHHQVRGSCHDTTPGLLSTGDAGPALVVRDAPLPLAQPRPRGSSHASRTDPQPG